jgi:formamidopyrimidine-DNA glycosylase
VPELPEVETVARTLRARVIGRTVESVEVSGLALRAPLDGRKLKRACEGARVTGVRRVGKYLLIDFSNDHVLLAHLGMSGWFSVVAARAPREPHTHAVFALDGGRELRYVDARRFGAIVPHRAAEVASSAELAALGPDPLSDAFTVAYLVAELASSRAPIKAFLLDQKRIAGLGNIYVSEALWVAGVSPRRRADRVGAIRGARLHRAIRDVLTASVARRCTTFRDYRDADGQSGDNAPHLFAYGRDGQPCRRCKTPIKRLVQGARSTFYCGACQR